MPNPASEFSIPQKVAALMAGFDRPWMVAGGWAADLFLQEITRTHGDIEIAIFRPDQLRLQAYLSGWNLMKVIPGEGKKPAAWGEGEYLKMPIHEIHAFSDNNDPSELEILFNEVSDNKWIFRRKPTISLPLANSIMKTANGLPFLSPEIILLYKAKNPSFKDEADFHRLYPRLDPSRQLWLRAAVETCYPEHRWLSLLGPV